MSVVREVVTRLGYDYDSSTLKKATEALQKYKSVLTAVAKAEDKAEASKAKVTKTPNQKAAQFKRLSRIRIKGDNVVAKVLEDIRQRNEASEKASLNRIRAKQKDHSIKRRIEAQLVNEKITNSAEASASAMIAADNRMTAKKLANLRKSKAETLQTLRMLQSIGRSVHNAGIVLGYTIGRPLAGFFKSSMRASAEFEVMETSFGVMLKSTEKAKNLMAEMITLARKTPLDIGGIAKTGKILLGTGMATEQVMNRIQQLGEVTGGKKDVFERIAWQYAQSVAKGRPQGDELRRFGEAGVPIEATIAQNLGIGQQAVREMSKKGQLTIQHLNDALDTLTGKGGLYAGMMTKMLGTVSGQLGKMFSLILEIKRNIGDDWKYAAVAVLKVINVLLSVIAKIPSPIRMVLVTIVAVVALFTGLVTVVSGLALLMFSLAFGAQTFLHWIEEANIQYGGILNKMKQMVMLQNLMGKGKGFKGGKGISSAGAAMAGAGGFGKLAGLGKFGVILKFATKAIPYIGLAITIISAIGMLAKFLGNRKKNQYAQSQDSTLRRHGRPRAQLDVNVNNNLTFPEGTSQQHMEMVEKTINRTVDSRFNKVVSGMIADTGGA